MKRHLVAVLACAFVLGGCVSASKLKDQESQTAAQQKRADGLQKDLDSAKASADEAAKKAADTEAGLRSQLKAGADQLASLDTQQASLNTQLAQVQQSNKDLKESLDAKKGELSKKVSELIKDKDSLSQKLAAATAELAARDKELAQTRDEKAALEKAKEEELAKVKQNYDNLTSGLQSEIKAGQVTITQLKGKLTVNMVDRILFDSGQADVRADGKKVLQKVGSILAGVADKDIRIEGHTDNKPIVGDLKDKYATNWELSTARATAVLRYLQDTAKVDGSHMVAAGYGEFRPVSPNDTAENRALNRRIEIVLVPRE
ncbi:MAG: OmpA family protein [Elusimicrobia bacterium]|nr:OmpA family protein [Elusimicrobiota bacterium]